MNKALCTMVLAVSLVVFGASHALALTALTSVDIDPGECDTFFGAENLKFEPANAPVVANANWIIAECHVKLDSSQLALIGGPVREAQHYWDFECRVETDGTAEDVLAFASHAVLTPKGNLNIFCIAAFAPETAE